MWSAAKDARGASARGAARPGAEWSPQIHDRAPRRRLVRRWGRPWGRAAGTASRAADGSNRDAWLVRRPWNP